MIFLKKILVRVQTPEARRSCFLMVNFLCLPFPSQHVILFDRWVSKHFMFLLSDTSEFCHTLKFDQVKLFHFKLALSLPIY